MRTLHADLTTAQTAATGIPYLRLHFEKGSGGATTYTHTTADSPNKIKALRHVEEPYNNYAILVLENSDGLLPDLFGYYCTVGYGYNTASGNKYSNAAPLWVKKQFHTSKMGSTDRIIYLEGAWNLLQEMKDIGSLLGATQPPYYEVDYTATAYTIYDIIEQVLRAATFGLYPLGGEDDSIIDTLQPDFVVNGVPFEDAATVIYRLMNMSKCFIRNE